MEPLEGTIWKRRQQVYLPGIDVAVDEAVIRYTGPNSFTTKLLNKQIEENLSSLLLVSEFIYSIG